MHGDGSTTSSEMSATVTNGTGACTPAGRPVDHLVLGSRSRSDEEVSGVVYRFRSELGTRWRSWLALGLLVGAVGGTVVLLAAGARRTNSAQDRFLRASRAYDVALATYCTPNIDPGDATRPNQDCQEEVARLPAVADATTVSQFPALVETLDGRSLNPDPTDKCYSGPGGVSVGTDVSGRFGTTINRDSLVAGRRANPAAMDEVVISQDTARRLRLRPGSALVIRLYGGSDCDAEPASWRPPVQVHVVGIELSPGEVRPPSGYYLQSVEVTPAFVRTKGSVPDRTDYLAARFRPGATPETLLRQAHAAGYTAEVVINQHDNAEAVNRAIRPSAASLAVLAAMTAFAGLAVIGQLLVRHASVESTDERLLAALGMGRGRRIALGLLRAATVALVAALVSVALAIALSPVMPIGLARLIEPDRGFAFDTKALAFGALGTFVFVIAVSVVPVWRIARVSRRDGTRAGLGTRARIANIAAQVGFPPTAVSGARLALERGAGATAVPVVSSFAGLTIAVAAVVGALTFGAGLTNLRSTPRLVGWNWDLVLTYPQTDDNLSGRSLETARSRAAASLRGHHGVTEYAMGTLWTPFPNGRPLQVGPRRIDVGGLTAFDGAAHVGPSLISGRKPATADEILLGPETLTDVGLHIGDQVEVVGQAGTWEKPGAETSARVRIVGTGVLPFGDRLGRGASMTLDGLARLSTEATEQAYFIRLAPGTDGNSVLDAFQRAFPEAPRGSIESFGFEKLPDPSLNLEQIDSVPAIFAALMGVMAVAVLAHVLVTATRARRRDLAVLRALGFSRGQTVRAVAYEATIYAVGALAIGSPVGIALGRLTWRVYASGLGVVPEAVTPWMIWMVMVAVSVATAVVIALQPAWRAARRPLAGVLRTE
jgi:hypothetical protein